MIRALATLVLLASAQARAEDEAIAKPRPVPASAVTVAQLPPVAGASQQYGAPASLPPVTARLFHLGGLLEVQPMFSVSVGDPFWRTVAMGMRVERHFDERWSIAAHTVAGVSLLSAPVEVCGGEACSSPAAEKLRSTPGKLQLLAGAELGWAPIYGKLSLFGERTLHFDAYVSAGPELLRELIAQDAASAESGRWAVGGRVAVGERLFLTDRFMVRVAATELIYGSRVRGLSEVERKLSFEGGVAWLFGR